MSSYDSIPTSHTPIANFVESDSNYKVVEMKVKKISAWTAVLILACAGGLAYAVVVLSGGAFTTTRMRGGDTTATTVLATAVTGTTEELSCHAKGHGCAGLNHANCCGNLFCKFDFQEPPFAGHCEP